MPVTISYYGGAAEAAGCDREVVTLEREATVADLRRELSTNAALAQVLAVSSVLVAGALADDAVVLPEDARVDVLPPFAGG